MKILPKLLLCATLMFVGCTPRKTPVQAPFNPPIEQKATHMVTFYQGTRPVGLCTATAIGPHALLTASHCNKDEKLTDIKLDIALNDFHIQKTLTDDRDHDIYLIDGPPFQNTVDYKVRAAKPGEHVHLYGNGEGDYPSHRQDGKRVRFDDPSEVDLREGVVRFDMKVIPGDSGSAVLADDGSIVAVTTYLWTDDKTKEKSTVDFQPGFTDDQITEAVTFAPDPNWKAPYVAPPALRRPPSFFDIFGQ